MGLFTWMLKTLEKIVGMATAIVFYWGDSFIQNIKTMVEVWFSRARITATSIFTFFATLAILLWMSVLIYGSFYYSYVPAVSEKRDVNLRFDANCHSHQGACRFPYDNISLVGETGSAILRRGQKYVLSMELEMPESPANQNLGMFMVRLDLYTQHGEVMHSAHRALMLKYKSTLLRVLETVFFLPLLLFDFRDQTQFISVELLDNFVEDPFKPVMGAFIEIQTPLVQLYKVVLKITAQFTGLRYLMFHWPILSAVVGVGIVMFFLTLVALLSWYNLFWGGTSEDGLRSTIVAGSSQSSDFEHLMDPKDDDTETLGTTEAREAESEGDQKLTNLTSFPLVKKDQTSDDSEWYLDETDEPEEYLLKSQPPHTSPPLDIRRRKLQE